MNKVKHLPNYSVSDYSNWEGNWELINGIPYAMSPSPVQKHQLIVGNLVFSIKSQFVNKQPKCNCKIIAELDWHVNTNTVVRPDVMIVCQPFETDFLQFAPDLIIEVTSKSTEIKDRNLKFELYQSNAVAHYIIINPIGAVIEHYTLESGRYVMKNNSSIDVGGNSKIQLSKEIIFDY